MIITVTCNPAIDRTIIENDVFYDVGGKGINVSKTLKEFGVDSMAIGFVGKANKNIVIEKLNQLKINNNFIEVDGSVRTNTKIIKNGELFEENELGPNVSEKSVEELSRLFNTYKNDIVVISGSTPSNLKDDFYANIVKILKKNNNYVIVDCANEQLKNVVKAKPNVIKPNKIEACELFNISSYDEIKVINESRKLGLDLVCLSLGEDGALFIGDDIYRCKAASVNCVDSVGAGDAIVAAIAYGKMNNYSIVETIKLAMASAGGACLTYGTKPCSFSNIKTLINEINIDKI